MNTNQIMFYGQPPTGSVDISGQSPYGSVTQIALTSLLDRHQGLEELLRARLSSLSIDNAKVADLGAQIEALTQQNVGLDPNSAEFRANSAQIDTLKAQQQTLVNVSATRVIEINQLTAKFNQNDELLSNLLKQANSLNESILSNMRS
ncbi:MAG: hypothetical protein V4623_07830 [Pseudomonadota bacterium]